ncbi:hypothetical protein SFUMM280S_08294 [Streptomyces fumanus]
MSGRPAALVSVTGMHPPLGDFDRALPAPDCLDELTRPVADAVRHWRGSVPAEQIVYVDTEPEWADTATFVEHYGRDLLERSANCVVVTGKRGGGTTLAACVVLSTTRVDVNGVVRAPSRPRGPRGALRARPAPWRSASRSPTCPPSAPGSPTPPPARPDSSWAGRRTGTPEGCPLPVRAATVGV